MGAHRWPGGSPLAGVPIRKKTQHSKGRCPDKEMGSLVPKGTRAILGGPAEPAFGAHSHRRSLTERPSSRYTARCPPHPFVMVPQVQPHLAPQPSRGSWPTCLGAWMPISWVFPRAYNLGSQDRREKDIVGVKDFSPFLRKFL